MYVCVCVCVCMHGPRFGMGYCLLVCVCVIYIPGIRMLVLCAVVGMVRWYSMGSFVLDLLDCVVL